MKFQAGSVLCLTSLLITMRLILQFTNAVTYNATLQMGQSVTTSDTIVSANGNFELGFFPEKNSSEYFVGTWFKNIPSERIVWVANRKHALTDSLAILAINNDGNLVIEYDEVVHFVTNISGKSRTHAMLLDSGNLILLNELTTEILWQSFDYPTDTLLPGMNIGYDLTLGYTWSLRSWTSAQDPRPGLFSLKVLGSRLLIMKKSEIYWIGDVLSNSTFQSSKNGSSNQIDVWTGYYFTWQGDYGSRLVLEVSGELNQEYWSEAAKRWVSLQSSECGTKGLCGNFSVCSPQAKNPCDCLHGFEPYDLNSWMQGNTSSGCVRKTGLLCTNTSSNNRLSDGFFLVDGVGLPSNKPLISKTSDESICQRNCSGNCSCLAYAYNSSKSECMLWNDQVLDLKNISIDVGYDNQRPSFLIKLAASELNNNESKTGNILAHKSDNSRRKLVVIGILIPSAALLTLCLFVYCYKRRKLRGKGDGEDLLLYDVGMSMKVDSSELSEGDRVTKVNKREVKLPLFSFASVSAATDNFSAENKLGEGGFGPVYKGKLLNGDEVAVKRLSTRSGQGWEELKNEALLIAKLQHNNLVRLLGCCIERDEKMLIYEFMPNKSLDFILFDATRRRVLDWETRVRIIDGIAQGLLYLHQYSRFRIIHRDLKTSNILLDTNMNPKISDFGMARMFGGNELQANTNRIVGTYGYMSPEYALEGIFSVKSDVFSFGVLLLEIITGKKNTGFYNTNSLNLLGYAWDLWTSGRGIELMDPVLQDSSIKQKMMLRYVNIALLCVQENPDDRPTMSDVVSMLGNEGAVLPFPKAHAFLNVRGKKNSSSAGSSSSENVSVNIVTASVMEPR